MRTNHCYFLHLVVASGNHSQSCFSKELSQECVVGRELGHSPLAGEREEGMAQGGGIGMGEKTKEGDSAGGEVGGVSTNSQ